jgi:hypothetical protein
MDGSLGVLLNGVSQQPQRFQQEGNVVEQINLYPNPSLGLTSRPPSVLDQVFSGLPVDAKLNTVLLGGNLYLIATYTDTLKMFSYSGDEYTVTVDADAQAYMAGDIVAYATDGKVYLVNRNKVVATTVPTSDGDYRFGYAYALGGEFSRTYTVTLEYSDNTVAVGTYTTPDGDVAGDSEKTAAGYIIDKIRDSLIVHANFKAATTVVDVEQEVMWVKNATWDFSLTANDGSNNTVVRAGVSEAVTLADVPRFAPHGAIIRIRGQAGSLADEQWIRFFSDSTTTLGAGFGLPGTWREVADPENLLDLDKATMPHVVTVNTVAKTAQVSRGGWHGRRAGSTTTNPPPSFVGNTISDIGEFQRRLWFIAGGSFIASKTKEPLDFWRSTVAAELATDVVDVKTSGEEESQLLFGVPYDTNLVVFSRAGQFLIDGAIGLTSQTINIVRTTKFEMSPAAKPVVSGDTVMFPYKQQSFSGVNELQPSSEITSNSVADLSSNTPRYIKGEITGMASAGNSKILLIQTDDNSNTLYVYNFLWRGQEKLQSAWHKWEFPFEVKHVYVQEGAVYLWYISDDETVSYRLRPDNPRLFGLPYTPTLDGAAVYNTAEPLASVSSELAFVSAEDSVSYKIGWPVTPASAIFNAGTGKYDYVFADDAPDTVVGGLVFETTLIPNKPLAADWRGQKRAQDPINIDRYIVDYVDSGTIEAYMLNKYRDAGAPIFVLESDTFPFDDDPIDNFGTAVSTGSFVIPWGETQQVSDLMLKTTKVWPVTYIELRWIGQVFKGY